MIKTYEDAIEYLKSFIPFTLYQTEAYQKKELKDPLDRMRYLLALLDHPEKKFKSILVGGTSGKGSTSYLISHILTTAGYRTGLTQSPHLVRINERIQLNGKDISDEDFLALINRVKPAIEEMKETEYGVPSYFEITIGMAFLYFAEEKVDIAVVEVGMGGTYDATNTIEPLIAVLTNVSLDHTQFLGNTVEEIAKTKAGIIKKGKDEMMVITAVKQPSVIKIVEDRCKEVGAKLHFCHPELVSGSSSNMVLGLVGDYQKENASLALEVIKQLQHFNFSVDDTTLNKALSTAHFPGRFELKELIINNWKLKIVLDGAHNQAKMHAFVTSLEKAYSQQKKVFVIAFKKDKDIDKMLKEILSIADTIIITEFKIGTDTMISNAAMDVENILFQISNLKFPMENIFLEKDSSKAIEKAISMSTQDSIIAITGSLYLLGELKQTITLLGQ